MTASEGLDLVRRWRQSGLSARVFCEAEGIGSHRLWYWNKRAKTSDNTDAGSRSAFVVLSSSDLPPEPCEVMEAEGMSAEPSDCEAVNDAVEVILGDGEMVRIPMGSASLAEIFDAVRASSR